MSLGQIDLGLSPCGCHRRSKKAGEAAEVEFRLRRNLDNSPDRSQYSNPNVCGRARFGLERIDTLATCQGLTGHAIVGKVHGSCRSVHDRRASFGSR